MHAPTTDHLLRTLAAVPPGARILDLGCADGRHAEMLAQLGFEVWACDHRPEHVAAARARLADAAEETVREEDPAALSFPDDHFDWVVALGGLDHTEADRPAVWREVRRVLAPGGWVIVGTDVLSPESLESEAAAADLALAERAVREPSGAVRGIFRKVAPGVAA